MKSNILVFALVIVLLSSCATEQKEESTVVSDTAQTVQDTTRTTQLATSRQISVPYVYGIDISKYQGDEIDFITRKGDTLSFVICKATEGITSTDPDFRNNWKMIADKGFIRGAYHFYHCSDDPVKQAAHFVSSVNAVDSFSREDFPPVIDFEEASIDRSCSRSQIQSNLLTFLKQVEQRTGRKPIIYTDNNTGAMYLNNNAFVNYPLYIADYTKNSSPALPGTWKNKQWVLWQKSETYIVHSTTTDFDIFNGSPQELQIFIANH